MHIVLIPGIWLDGRSWSRVVPQLRRAGHDTLPLTLPGMESRDADRSGIRLQDHVAATVAAIDSISGDILLVGHSAGASIAHAALDARGDRIARAVYVSGVPAGDGEPIAADYPVVNGEVPLPAWPDFAAGELTDLDAVLRAEFRLRTIPSPAHVVRGRQQLGETDRARIPITVIATDFSGQELRERIDREEPAVAELRHAADLTIVDLPTGHWPQFTRPDDLATHIREAASQQPREAPVPKEAG